MRPGAHLNTGSSLGIGDNSVGGQLQIAKPVIAASQPKPDLTVTKTGDSTAGLSASVTYRLDYQNKSATVYRQHSSDHRHACLPV